MNIDLDAARAARAEAQQETPTVTFAGQTFTLPAEPPFSIAEAGAALSNNDPSGLMKVVEAILGDQAETFLALKPSMLDVKVLSDGLARVYGFADMGESQASAP